MQRKSLLPLAFLSGIGALIYEISWVRQATLTFGVSIYAYSAVLMAYMGGMAISGYLIGKRADRNTNPLRLFAWLQLGMAGLGLLSPFVLTGLTVPYAALARHLASRLTVLTVLGLGTSLLVLAPPPVDPNHPVGGYSCHPLAWRKQDEARISLAQPSVSFQIRCCLL